VQSGIAMPAGTMKQGGLRQTRSQLRPGQSAARSAGEVTASTLAEDGGLATLSADNICMHFVKHAVS
jgi:hypothetical protein